MEDHYNALVRDISAIEGGLVEAPPQWCKERLMSLCDMGAGEPGTCSKDTGERRSEQGSSGGRKRKGESQKRRSKDKASKFAASGTSADAGHPENWENGETGSNACTSHDESIAKAKGNTKGVKKGTPWTQEEHRLFLLGLTQYGKGDWRNISRKFVISRTPTQVASHAQKYFIRLNSLNGNHDRRRTSIHDITHVPENHEPPSYGGKEGQVV